MLISSIWVKDVFLTKFRWLLGMYLVDPCMTFDPSNSEVLQTKMIAIIIWRETNLLTMAKPCMTFEINIVLLILVAM